MKIMPINGFTIFISLFFAVGFGILGYGIYSLVMSNKAKAWPTTEGYIKSCKLVESNDQEDGSNSFIVEVKYRYTVAGNRYQGERIAFGYSGSDGRKSHQEIKDKLSSAKTILVRYDPASPSQAVLSCGLNRSTILLLVFGGFWLLLITGFTILWIVGSRCDTGVLQTLVTTS